MMEPAVEMSPQSLVTKTLGSFVKLIVTRFVRFCPTWLRTCEVWPISLIFAVEEETLIFCAAPLTQPAKVTSMDESASQAPPSHSTSFFSSATINSQPLWLDYFPISFPLLFLSFPPHPPPCFSLFLYLPDSHLPPLSLPFHSLLHHMGIIFLETRREKTASSPPRKTCRESNADLDSQLTSYTLSCAREELQRAVGAAGVWSPGEHQRTVRHTRTSARPETVQEREVWLKISRGKGMMGFFCCTQSHFSHLTGWMCHSYGSQIGGQDKFQG